MTFEKFKCTSIRDNVYVKCLKTIIVKKKFLTSEEKVEGKKG